MKGISISTATEGVLLSKAATGKSPHTLDSYRTAYRILPKGQDSPDFFLT